MSTQTKHATHTPPRVYKTAEGIPCRVVIYGRDAPGAPLRIMCEQRDPTPQDLENFNVLAHALAAHAQTSNEVKP